MIPARAERYVRAGRGGLAAAESARAKRIAFAGRWHEPS